MSSDGFRIDHLPTDDRPVTTQPTDPTSINGREVLRETELARHDAEALSARLDESEARFRMIADNMSQLAWTCDELGNATWYNQRWLDYTGLTFEEMKDWGWKAVQHPDHLDRVVESVNRSRESGEVWEDTFPIRGADGKFRWFLSRAMPIVDDEGNIVQWFGTNTDITEELEAKQALQTAKYLLEERVFERTKALTELARELENEIHDRKNAEAQVREMLDRLLNIQEEERLRLGRNVHDDLGQHLTALRIHLASLLESMMGRDDDLTDQCGTIAEIGRELDDAVELIAWTLRPGYVDQVGLTDALKDLVEGWSTRFGISAEFKAVNLDESTLSAQLRIQLYRIAKEALHNIFKHAKATSVSVIVGQRANRIRLLIEDNGIGIQRRGPRSQMGGQGLASMKERAEILAGSFSIESSKGLGTTVIVDVPVSVRKPAK